MSRPTDNTESAIEWSKRNGGYPSDDPVCAHCGGPQAIRNPTGKCDHLYWPELLTDEAKRANGYREVIVTKIEWVR